MISKMIRDVDIILEQALLIGNWNSIHQKKEESNYIGLKLFLILLILQIDKKIGIKNGF